MGRNGWRGWETITPAQLCKLGYQVVDTNESAAATTMVAGDDSLRLILPPPNPNHTPEQLSLELYPSVQKSSPDKQSRSHRWTASEESFLRQYYPSRGKQFCMQALQHSEAAIRWKASQLGLSQDRTSEFFADWQSRAAASKKGKKRPAQAEVIKRLIQDGKVHTPEQHARAAKKLHEWKTTHPHPKGMAGKTHSVEARAKMSESQKRLWSGPDSLWQKLLDAEPWRRQARSDHLHNLQAQGKLREGYSRGKQGKRADLNHTYFRSAWEANYARYLNLLIQQGVITHWEYEGQTFIFEAIKRGTRSYTPDFKVTLFSGNYEWHEVKGWMDQKSRTKLARMAQYFPEEPIVLIDKGWFTQANRMGLSRIIPHWE